ncbi:hypothetical protein [Haloferula helveola]
MLEVWREFTETARQAGDPSLKGESDDYHEVLRRGYETLSRDQKLKLTVEHKTADRANLPESLSSFAEWFLKDSLTSDDLAAASLLFEQNAFQGIDAEPITVWLKKEKGGLYLLVYVMSSRRASGTFIEQSMINLVSAEFGLKEADSDECLRVVREYVIGRSGEGLPADR